MVQVVFKHREVTVTKQNYIKNDIHKEWNDHEEGKGVYNRNRGWKGGAGRTGESHDSPGGNEEVRCAPDEDR